MVRTTSLIEVTLSIGGGAAGNIQSAHLALLAALSVHRLSEDLRRFGQTRGFSNTVRIDPNSEDLACCPTEAHWHIRHAML
jgi:hypothetical protein